MLSCGNIKCRICHVHNLYQLNIIYNVFTVRSFIYKKRLKSIQDQLLVYLCFVLNDISSLPLSKWLDPLSTVNRITAILTELNVHLKVDHSGWKLCKLLLLLSNLCITNTTGTKNRWCNSQVAVIERTSVE